MSSPFDKNKKAPENKRSKVVLATVLGLALVGVLGYQVFGHSLRTALGSPGEGPAQVLVPTQSADDEIKSLAQDPARDLLQDPAASSSPLDVVPTKNPFAMDKDWYGTLVKPAPVNPNPDPHPNVVQVQPTNPTGPKINLEQFKLQGIMRDGSKLVAIVNGQFLGVGETILGTKIVDIKKDRVVFQPIGFGDATRFEVALQSGAP